MKLGNKGSSVLGFFIICIILLVCLLISGYYCFILFGAINEEEGNDYIKLETKLSKATLKYNKKYGYEDEVISSDTLKKLGFLKDLKDIYGDECQGYIKIDNLIYIPYVKCNEYQTEGYGL